MANANGSGTFSSFTYTLDAVGNRTQMVDGSDTHLYEYDDLYRLTTVPYPGSEVDTPMTRWGTGSRKTTMTTPTTMQTS